MKPRSNVQQNYIFFKFLFTLFPDYGPLWRVDLDRRIHLKKKKKSDDRAQMCHFVEWS